MPPDLADETSVTAEALTLKIMAAGGYSVWWMCCRCSAEWDLGETSEVQGVRGMHFQLLTLCLHNPKSKHFLTFCAHISNLVYQVSSSQIEWSAKSSDTVMNAASPEGN